MTNVGQVGVTGGDRSHRGRGAGAGRTRRDQRHRGPHQPHDRRDRAGERLHAVQRDPRGDARRDPRGRSDPGRACSASCSSPTPLIGIVQEVRAKRTLDQLAVLNAAARPRGARRRRGRGRRRRRSCSTTCSTLARRRPDPVRRRGPHRRRARGRRVAAHRRDRPGRQAPRRRGALGQLRGRRVRAGSRRPRSVPTRTRAKLAAEARRFPLTRSELMDGINRILRIVTWVLIPVVGAAALEPAAATTTLDAALRRHGRRRGRHGARGTRAADERRVRGRRGHPGPAQGAGAGAARGRGARPRRRGVPRQDRHAHRGRDRLRRARAARRQPTRRRPARRSARSPTTRTATRPLDALAAAFAPPGAGRASGAVPFSSARKWSAASFDGHGTWVMGAPEMVLPDDALARARPRADELAAERPPGAGARARRDAPLDGETLPAGPATRSALVMFAEKVRPDAAETLAYFAEQGVALEGDLRRQPAHRRRGRGAGRAPRRRRAGSTPASSPRTPTELAERARSATRCSAGSRRSRSGRWSARCSRRGTSWR